MLINTLIEVKGGWASKECHRQAPGAEFSELISRAVTAILNPTGHTVCLTKKDEWEYRFA